MGLAASQARLLLLTSRRSDLEYRAQMISQHKIALAMETEQIATEYTNALNNRKLEFTYTVKSNGDAKNGSTETENLSYGSLLTGSSTFRYRLVDRDGNIVCLNKQNEKSRYSEEEQAKMKEYPEIGNDAWLAEALQAGLFTIQKEFHVGNMEPTFVNNADNTKVITLAQYNALPANAEEAGDGKDHKMNYARQEGAAVYEWQSQVFSGMSEISSVLNTDDDNIAMATYERKSLEVQTKDKQLDVELKQVETQLEACKSEQESVKKLIQDHAQNDFKSFA